MQPCVELAPPVELVPSAGGAQDPDRLSVSPKHPLQIVARARAFLQRLVDSVGLLLVGRQQRRSRASRKSRTARVLSA